MGIKSKVEAPVHVGSILLTAEPFVSVLKSSLKSERCNFCLKRAKVMRCSGCHYVYYCTRVCQKQAWDDHKHECHSLKKVYPRTVPDAAHLMARIILKLQRGGDQEKGYYSETGFRKFKDLMSHYSDLKQDAKRMEHFTSLSAVLIDLLGESTLPNTAELMGIYGRMCVNGFNILDPEMVGIGTGIYLAASIIDHSCDPNAVAVFEGTKVIIRAIKQMPSLDWKKVRITYIDLLNSTQTRRTELQKGYYFTCDCSRCLDPEEHQIMNSAQCPNSECQKPVPITNEIGDGDHICPACEQVMKSDLIKKYREISEFTQQQLEVMKDVAYVDVCKVCIQKQQGLLHPLNLLRAKVLDLAFESSIELSKWEDACDFGEQLQDVYKKYYGELHPLTGIFHLKQGKLLLYQEKQEAAWKHLSEAKTILSVTHGLHHTLFQNDLMPLISQCQTEM